jgi:formylmethanofuran dehydrogenase subunit E
MEAQDVGRGIHERPFDDLIAEAARFHGHVCPGTVLGVRIKLAGLREVGVCAPRAAGKSLVVIVEIDRCATDAIEALTGASLGKRTLKHADFGKTAATFVNVTSGVSTRVAARDSARALARQRVPAVMDPRQAQMVAYRDMPEGDLLTLERVVVDAAWLTRRRVRVPCAACGEHVNYEREVQVGGRTLCRGCAGERYYRRYEPRHIAPAEVRAS